MYLFQTGAETFTSRMIDIVPVVLMLMVAMDTLIAFPGEERVTKVARPSARDPVTRYLVLPSLSVFMLGNPMSFTMARFLLEYYKPSYYATRTQFCHTSNGILPHISPGRLFVWSGTVQGTDTLGLNSMDLAIRYMFAEILMNFIGGWVTDSTIAYACRQQGITLSKTVEIAVD